MIDPSARVPYSTDTVLRSTYTELYPRRWATAREGGGWTKSDAMQGMKDARAQSAGRPTKSALLGTVENTAGQIVGCRSMVEEGQQRIPDKRGVEEQSGTG